MADVQPKYRYTNAENPRSYNKAYYLTIDSKRIRVCKLFFKNTLGITDRMIQTTKSKYDVNGIVLEDFRGKHENHKKIPAELVSDIREPLSQYLASNRIICETTPSGNITLMAQKQLQICTKILKIIKLKGEEKPESTVLITKFLQPNSI